MSIPTYFEGPDLLAWWVLGNLRRQWNNLYSLDYEYDYDSSEYKLFLRVLEEVIKRGRSSYLNPIGEDDTEAFENCFQRLNIQDKRAFYAKALKCHAEKRAMTESDIIEVVEMEAFFPLYMDVEKGSDEGKNRGTARNPFKTEDALMVKLEELSEKEDVDDWLPVVYCVCNSEKCTLRKCSFEGCKTKVCSTHGVGQAQFRHEEIKWTKFECDVENPDPEFARLAPIWKSMAPGDAYKAMQEYQSKRGSFQCTVAFCLKHGEKGVTSCFICGCNAYIQRDVYECDYDMDDVTRCCKEHLTVCDGRNEETGELCGFNCCPSCLEDHQCGVDPTDCY